MILYWYNNDIESGQIANGDSVVSSVNDLLWDINENSLKPITGSFYLKVNVEMYSKYYYKYSSKTYNYPGLYNLKCYYDKLNEFSTAKTVSVIDSKFIN
jgi:hypothetical protein